MDFESIHCSLILTALPGMHLHQNLKKKITDFIDTMVLNVLIDPPFNQNHLMSSTLEFLKNKMKALVRS